MPACRTFVPVHGIEPWLIPCLTCNPSVPLQWDQVTGDPPVVVAAAAAAVVVEPCCQMYVVCKTTLVPNAKFEYSWMTNEF